MSNIYVLEPPTKGKVIFNSTVGPLDIELWPKEAPKAVRNFVQLCLEGYYNNTNFHRIIKSFMVQGGDKTGTGQGGETIYGAPFADEFHSRLRFKHRGLVACANAGSPNTNNSQFFISLDRCDWLDRKHTIFGKVTGESIFNLLKLGDIETGEDDRPIDSPPKIISVEVLWNPFEDIVPRKILNLSEPGATEEPSKEEKKKRTKKLNLLSFGDEVEEEEKALASVKEKIKSSHDVLSDPRLLKGEAELDSLESIRKKELQTSVREALNANKIGSLKKGDKKALSDVDGYSDEDEADFDARMRQHILGKRKQLGDLRDKPRDEMKEKDILQKREPSSPTRISKEDSDDQGARQEKLTLKKKGLGSQARANLAENADVDAQLLGPAEQRRQMYKQKKRSRQGREEETLARLEKFKNFLGEPKNLPTDKSELSNDEDNDMGWHLHTLKFMSDASKKDDMATKDDPDAYTVHDPLLEKGKEKFNKMQAKMKRRQREWAGKSLT
ncbi:hypothetical protein SUGI_0954400 [Cryptomeria japonica]|uniref:peptidyl-prolyl cis-trans isomerase CYP57 n=1 Tax=Cryptomeria japonica TaxID=3369 RepID=UPI002414CC44|nr:peptidyl-prolyl cis-trans isomerase CYP57 [Cryptomeria japonica]GLJ45343.1 hypothetical protein SUGI_0954400 [Cryptomeria japonica]